ncbi:Vesicle-associated membrane protein-associated protein A [Penicillium cataractarum]|uniref:Vesicle-associated membrane protein-associated protein A n=1 Tax=Penicillium cataractarum TaxID=2100454 RepID=A0A9W9US81_9EURO|nr:Vesicle-associated membrane protein-associated protein A [Penicillium cataractarum]KAJ5355422.1 Vesicle-associated membrane protein-associated protein A [Penicillium cataractarum]
MSIELDPPELGFKRPFNQEVCQILHLRNPTQEPMVFKVKTTAPKHYCVRPNSGRIEPGKQVDVQVLLQAMKEEPAADQKCKDKFLVQSVAVTGGDMEYSNVTSIFEKASKSAVIERKIRVTWLPADSAASQQSQANDSVLEDEPPAYTSPGGNYETPAVGLAKKSPVEQPSPIPAPDFSEKSIQPESPQPTESSSSFANAKAAVTSAFPSSDELKSQLADANAQIQRLKDRLADQGLRQRKTGGEAPAAPATMQQSHGQTESGVSVQAVAGLCLISFLIAYFFF